MTVMRHITERDRKPVALVMQGGGALGAYEWGAVRALCEDGYYPVAVAGVSIGAVNAAAIAGAHRGDVVRSLDTLWTKKLTNPFLLDALPWFAPFGHPGMYYPRMDFLNFQSWTACCGVAPLRSTLEEICDFDQINNPSHMGFAVTAAEVATGALRRFLNKGPDWKARPNRITPDHVLASGALPPGFPRARVDGRAYWDGGLFDNTPVRPMIDLLDDEQADDVPIVQINLFPEGGQEMPLPRNMGEVFARKMELTFENRFWDDYATTEYDGLTGLRKYAQMIRILRAEMSQHPLLRDNEQFKTLLKRRCLGNLHVIKSDHQPTTGGLDFTLRGIWERHDKGYKAVKDYNLDQKVWERRVLEPAS